MVLLKCLEAPNRIVIPVLLALVLHSVHVAVANQILCDYAHVVAALLVPPHRLEIPLDTQDGLYAHLLACVVRLNQTIGIAVVGRAKRLIPQFLCKLRKLQRIPETIERRIFVMPV